MKLLQAFSQGNGAHCGLSDWYENGEAELKAALADHIPFDTGWYSSKKEIASARIWSEDGIKIKVEVFVSDDFDTTGIGYASTGEWLVDAIHSCINKAWEKAESDRDDSQEYEGFRVGRNGRWEETYIVNIGWDNSPPDGHYHWWGWQYDVAEETVGVPDPNIPAETVQAFEGWARDWVCGVTKEKSFTVGEWTITPWRDSPTLPEDPSDYVGMGWVDQHGRP